MRRGFRTQSISLADALLRNRNVRDRGPPSDQDTDALLTAEYMLDLTGTGIDQEKANRSACLSDNAKDTIYYLHTDHSDEYVQTRSSLAL